MKILRGPMAGLDVVPHQFGTDWITATDTDGNPLMFNGRHITLGPQNVQLTTDRDREVFAPQERRDGLFWDVWELTDDGTFVRKTTVEALTRPSRRPEPTADQQVGRYFRARRGT